MKPFFLLLHFLSIYGHWQGDHVYEILIIGGRIIRYSTRQISWPFTNCLVESGWNVMAHGDAREGKWRGKWRMEWVACTLHTTSGLDVSSITTADAHSSAASSRLNRHPRRFKWTRPFRRKMKSGFCACAITFKMQSTTSWCSNIHDVHQWRTLKPLMGYRLHYYLFTYLVTYLLAYWLTYLLIYVLTPPWESNRFSAIQELIRILWNPKVHYRIHKCAPPVPLATAWHVLMWRMKERIPIRMVAANILNKQSRAAVKGCSSSLGVGRRTNNSSP